MTVAALVVEILVVVDLKVAGTIVAGFEVVGLTVVVFVVTALRVAGAMVVGFVVAVAACT